MACWLGCLRVRLNLKTHASTHTFPPHLPPSSLPPRHHTSTNLPHRPRSSENEGFCGALSNFPGVCMESKNYVIIDGIRRHRHVPADSQTTSMIMAPGQWETSFSGPHPAICMERKKTFFPGVCSGTCPAPPAPFTQPIGMQLLQFNPMHSPTQSMAASLTI